MVVTAPRSEPVGSRPVRAAAVLAAGTGLAVAAAWLLYITRGTTFWQDEWVWVLYRRGNSLATFLDPHNQHFSLIPLLIYRALLATAGLRHYAPYRVTVVAAHEACVLVVFLYGRRRAGAVPAALAAALLLCLGAGWGNILWPFQMAWFISLATGLLAFMMLDRGDRPGGAAACALLAVSLASCGLGAVVLLGMAAELVLSRRWRSLWVVGVPGLLYGVWWLTYQQLGTESRAALLPRFIADEAASTVAALLGLAGRVGTSGLSSGTLLTFGRPLALAALLLGGWRLLRTRRVSPRLVALAVMLVAFWVLSAISRAFIGVEEAWASRYLYVSGFFVVLLGLELARGARLGTWAQAALVVVGALAVISNIGQMEGGARYLRAQAATTRADLTAMDITRPIILPGYVSLIPNFPFPVVVASRYFAAERALGTPAVSPGELARLPEAARASADTELVQIHHVALRAAAGARCAGPPADVPAGRPVKLPTGGMLLRAGPSAAQVSVRRFAAAWTPVGHLAAGHESRLGIGPDLARRPWFVRASAPLQWCRDL